jgi:hypothetical protein
MQAPVLTSLLRTERFQRLGEVRLAVARLGPGPQILGCRSQIRELARQGAERPLDRLDA